MDAKPFSQACENNKEPILAVLRDAFSRAHHVLEIGSGTGQHAAFFAARLPYLRWTPSDLVRNHPGIRAWLSEAALPNLDVPLELDVMQTHWPELPADAVFSANTAHIMPWHAVEHMFRGVANLLPAGGVFCLYGPFNYGGRYTSDSNRRFDAWLKAQDPQSGIRNVEHVGALAQDASLALAADHAMPANNRLLVWHRS